MTEVESPTHPKGSRGQWRQKGGTSKRRFEQEAQKRRGQENKGQSESFILPTGCDGCTKGVVDDDCLHSETNLRIVFLIPTIH